MSSPTGPRDVRMRGFSERATVEAALAWIDTNCHALPEESVSLAEACGRVLARPLIAGMNVPPFYRAAMDGYAIRAEETTGSSDYSPTLFQVVGQVRPGMAPVGEVLPGQALRIMTGAPLPPGADAVVPAEFARETAGTVELTQAVSPGKHVGSCGEDVQAGQTLLPAGHRLRPQDVGVLAALGQAVVSVVRQPRVKIIVTGDELVLPGEPRGEYQIYEVNSFLLRGLIARDGGQLVEVQRVRDERELVRQALVQADCDLLLISGGTSVGAEDHAPLLLAELGELAIHGIAMRPSSPAGMGRIGSIPVFLLPGNPVSCLCAYDFFAGRALRLTGGLPAAWPYRRITAPLSRKIASAIGRVDYCRVRVTEAGVEPLALSGASILSSTVRADGFVIVPAESEGAAPGTLVEVYLWN